MKASVELLNKLKEISNQISELSANPSEYDLDIDAIVDLNLALDSLNKLVHRVERIPSMSRHAVEKGPSHGTG
jgi:hypothetical protein